MFESELADIEANAATIFCGRDTSPVAISLARAVLVEVRRQRQGLGSIGEVRQAKANLEAGIAHRTEPAKTELTEDE